MSSWPVAREGFCSKGGKAEWEECLYVFYEVGRGSEEGLHLSEGNKSPSVVSVDQCQTLSERDALSVCSWLPKKKTASQIICKTFSSGWNRSSQLLLAVFIPLCFLLPHCVQPFKHCLSKSSLPNIKWFLWGHLWKRRNFISFISCATAVFFFPFWLSYLTGKDPDIQTFIPWAFIRGDFVEGFNILNALLCPCDVTEGP